MVSSSVEVVGKFMMVEVVGLFMMVGVRSSWTWRWNQFARYQSEADADQLRDQLLNCLDTALQVVVYRALGSNVDTITQADLLTVIELLAVEEVEKIV